MVVMLFSYIQAAIGNDEVIYSNETMEMQFGYTFGTCAGYPSHFTDCSLPVGALLRFKTPDFFTVAEGNSSAAAQRVDRIRRWVRNGRRSFLHLVKCLPPSPSCPAAPATVSHPAADCDCSLWPLGSLPRRRLRNPVY